MKALTAVLCFLVLLAGISTVNATDYYVATWGDNSSSGNLTHPWKNISYAAQQAQAGDTVYLVDGTWYDENVVFAHSGNITHPITFTAYNGTPTLEGEIGKAFYFDRKSYITVQNLKIEGYDRAFDMLSYGGVSNLNIINNTINGTNSNSVNLYGMCGWTENINVSYNTITNAGYHGIDPMRCVNSTIKGNTITTTNRSGICADAGNRYLTCEDNILDDIGQHGFTFISTNGTTIRNNTISNVTEIGIRFDTVCYNNTIENNILSGSSILFYQNNEATVRNNIADRLRTTGANLTVYDNIFNKFDFNDGPAWCKNNTIIFENNTVGGGPYADFSSCVNTHIANNRFIDVPMRFCNFPSYNVTVANNIFYNISGTAIDITETTGNTDEIYIRNNIFMNVTGNCVNKGDAKDVYVSYNDVWNNGSLAFYNVTDTNTLYQDPLFYNVSADDFHINSTAGTWNGTAWEIMSTNSPCIDAGDPSDDYSNEPFFNGGRINMGAYGNTQYASKSGTSFSANSWGLLRQNPIDNTYTEIAANISNDIVYSHYNSTSALWEPYYTSYSINQDLTIHKHESYFVWFDAATSVTCTEASAENIAIPANKFYYTYLRENTSHNLTAINASIQSDGITVNSLYSWNSTAQAYTNTDSYTVNPNEALMIYSSTGGTWDGSV